MLCNIVRRGAGSLCLPAVMCHRVPRYHAAIVDRVSLRQTSYTATNATESEASFLDRGAVAALQVLPRHSASLIIGPLNTDDTFIAKWDPAHTKTVQQLRKRVETAIQRKNSFEFVDTAHDAFRWMESLPSRHIYHWPYTFGLWKSPMPASTIIDTSLARIFAKVTGSLGNGSGMALEGARGVGKSHLLRLLCQVSGLLLPQRVVYCYINYDSRASYSTLPATPAALLRAAHARTPPRRSETIDAVPAAVRNWFQEHGIDESLAKSTDLAAVLATLSREGRTPLVFADGVSSVYLNPTIWAELHDLATQTNTFTVVADNSILLRAMVSRSGDPDTLRCHFPSLVELPQSLNDDKLKPTKLLPFTNEEQYRVYLQHCLPSSSASTVSRAMINRVHMCTGGRLRAIEQNTFELPPLPDTNSADYAVLKALTKKQAEMVCPNGGVEMDAFRAAALSPREVFNILAEWRRSSNNNNENPADTDDDDDVVDNSTLLDNNTLMEHPTMPGHFTFGTPAHYSLMQAASLR